MPIEGRFVYGDDYYMPEEYMDEQWEVVESCPNYVVSDKGRVWSKTSECFVKPKPMDKHGHLGICMSDHGQKKYAYTHRLMAEAFLPNPDGLPIVRHLDDDPSYNVLDNLAWGTQKDNMRDCKENGHAYYPTDEDRYKGNRDRMMDIIATNIETGEEIHFESQGEAGRNLGIPQANIWKVLRGKRNSAQGYYFRKAVG